MSRLFLIPLIVVVSGASCGKADEGPDVKKPDDVTYWSQFVDTLYQNGFRYGRVVDGVPGDAGLLTYGGAIRDHPTWGIGQWNNYNNDLKDAAFTDAYPTYAYRTRHGTGVVVDVASGKLQLNLNTSSEYGHSPVCPVNPRRVSDKWPHLLLSSDFTEERLLALPGKTEVIMDIDFSIDGLADRMPAGTYDPGLHAAQFQWFITVQNRKAGDDGYGEYFWFGLSYFDSRYDYTPFFAARDGNTTGAFIYMPAMEEVLAGQGKTEIGKRMQVKTDILPILRIAFDMAQARGYMARTDWGDLHIASTNIGWEVPGTYDVSATLNAFNIRYR